MTSETTGDNTHAAIHARVAAYYTDKLRQYGPTPRGADWRDKESQESRFSALLQIFDGAGTSLTELGCGYGALLGYMRHSGFDLAYYGYDLSEAMIATARKEFSTEQSARFEIGSVPREVADYCVASGIFNVRFDITDKQWREYIFDTLDLMAAVSVRGFAFNCLTSHSDPDRREARLYYADPGEMLNHCIARYGRRISILHGSLPYEFTMLARHDRPR